MKYGFKDFDHECTKAEKLERWRNCERVLLGLDEHQRERHWDMSDWGRETECGTIACAAGHCSLDPWFSTQGFQFRKIYSSKVEAMFGSVGTETIFCDYRPRSVEEVIEEVRRHILDLELL